MQPGGTEWQGTRWELLPDSVLLPSPSPGRPWVLSDSSQSSLLFGLLDTCLEGVGEGAGPGTPLLEKPPQPGEIGQYGAFFIK